MLSIPPYNLNINYKKEIVKYSKNNMAIASGYTKKMHKYPLEF
jgi:hypothetical protein